MKEKEKKKQMVKISVLITSIFVIFLSLTYAFINVQLKGEKKQTMVVGELSLELLEDENNLTIINALPMYDEVGMLQSPFTFRLINNGNVPVHYLLKLADITTGETLNTSIVKYGLTKDESKKINLLSNLEDNQIDTGIIRESQTIEYSLRLWINSTVEDNTLIKDKSLSYKIGVEVSQVEGTTKDIVFNVDGDESVFQPKTVVIGDSYGELPIPTKTGYTFSNWNDEEGKVITNKSIVELDTEKLTANWKANEYTITFDANGGSIDTTSKTVIYNGTYGDLPIPTGSNKIFAGWYTEKTNGEKIESTSEVKILDNQTLYAHWAELVKDKLFTSTNLGTNCKTYNDGIDTFLAGQCSRNYIQYSDRLWRVVLKNNTTGTIKMITQDSVTTSLFDSSQGKYLFANSIIDNYLKTQFLPTLSDYSKFLVVNHSWDVTPVKYNNEDSRTNYSQTVERTVALLTRYELYTVEREGSFNSYLRINQGWWQLTPRTDSTSALSYMTNKNSRSWATASYSPLGVRPVVNLLPTITISKGEGTASNPYFLTGNE